MRAKRFLGILLSLVLIAGMISLGDLNAQAADDAGYTEYTITINTYGKGNVTLDVPYYATSGFMTLKEDNVIAVNKAIYETDYNGWRLGSILGYVREPEPEGYNPGPANGSKASYVFADPATLTDYESYFTERNNTLESKLPDIVDENGCVTVNIAWFERVDTMTVEVEAPVCGTTLTEESVPTVTVSDGKVCSSESYFMDNPFWASIDSETGEFYDPPYAEGKVTGGEEYSLYIPFDANCLYYYNPKMTEENVSVVYTDGNGDQQNGTVLYVHTLEIGEEAGHSQMYVTVNAVHDPGETVIENEVAPTCTENGSHDEVVYCEGCGAELSRETVVDEALGHDWGDWEVTAEPQIDIEGEETSICRRDSSHIQTRPIDPLVGYTVTFESNGGSEVESQKVLENETAEEPEDPTKDGFTFAGWFADGELTEEYDFAAAVTADITLYAKWEEAPAETFTITFNLNGGTLDGQTADITVQAEAGSEITLLDAPDRDGYKFLYWKGSEYQPSARYTVTEDHTFTAEWQQIPDGPITGDESDIPMWAALMGVSLIGFVCIAVIGRKKTGRNSSR